MPKSRNLALAALAVLAGAIFAAVDRALGASEDVLAHAAVELIFGAGALRHVMFSNSRFKCPEPHRWPCADAITASPGMRDQLRAAHLGSAARSSARPCGSAGSSRRRLPQLSICDLARCTVTVGSRLLRQIAADFGPLVQSASRRLVRRAVAAHGRKKHRILRMRIMPQFEHANQRCARFDQRADDPANRLHLARRPAGLGEDRADGVLRRLGARRRVEIALGARAPRRAGRSALRARRAAPAASSSLAGGCASSRRFDHS